MRSTQFVSRIALLGITSVISIAAGCHSNFVNKEEFRSALSNYYSSRQYCLWTDEIKFPAQADAAKEDQTRRFDALTDAGLLTRMAAEKKRFLIGSKQVNDYDLSDNGRAHWTADTSQPGYGNFCVGHEQVTSIDDVTPAANSGTTQYSVSYRYAVKLPDWANTVEIKNAFPNAGAATAGQSATATLTQTGNGWQVSNVAPSSGVQPGQ
jgi:hypothetical protein